MIQKYKVVEEYNNMRFDKWFKSNIKNLPQSLLQKLIRKNKIKINKKKTKNSYRVKSGDLIELYHLEDYYPVKLDRKIRYKANKKDLKKLSQFIIEDNENFVVLNKPSGIPVQGGTKSFKNIIDIAKDSKLFLYSKPFIVHRIDKETSGLFMIAKNKKYAQLLTSLFRIRKIHKTYIAIVYGKVSTKIKKLDHNIITFENNKKQTQKALTYLNVIKSNDNYSLVELNPFTGRKHQLRKQLLNIGHPIVGDKKYFINKFSKEKSLLLHSYKLKFMINNLKFNFEASLNQDMQTFLNSKFI